MRCHASRGAGQGGSFEKMSSTAYYEREGSMTPKIKHETCGSVDPPIKYSVVGSKVYASRSDG